jgi:predicted ATPase/class 3 adenylate cyclase
LRVKNLPTGTVTFLFADIEDSTPLVERLGAARYRELVEAHAEIMRKAIGENGGVDLSTAGDSFFAVFERAPSAVRAAVDAQTGLSNHEWPDDSAVKVRMGVHTGDGALGGDNYIGIDVNIAARVEAAGHGGQILVSGTTSALVRRELPEGASLADLGTHRLKGVAEPEQIFQLNVPALDSEFPPIRTLDARSTNLPVLLTNFIGRERELEEIKRLLGQTRLLTLTGPGGTGKTRLALQVAADSLDDFDDGVFFIPLASIENAEGFMTSLASELSISESGSTPLRELVQNHLEGRELLLVLDNFEQLVSAGGGVAELLLGAPKVKAIVTSRERLHVSGEQEFQVPPLGLPDPKHLPAAEALSQFDAVALFLQRARSVDSDFSVTNENAPAVAEIAARLDGLPLAIELAAARVKLLSPDAMLARMQSRLTLLRSGTRDVPQRQKTLRDAIAWSFDLLSEEERRLFRRLAVFVDGFTFETAEEVVGDDVGIDLFDGVSSLLDKSLIRQDQDERERGRFNMLETIREFAIEQLEESGERVEVGTRHSGVFERLAETAEPKLESQKAPEWLDRLETEHGNLRATLDFLVDQGFLDKAMMMAGRVWRLWHFRGHLTEGRNILERLLGLPGADAPTASRAKALLGLAGITYWQADYVKSGDLYGEALDIYRSLGDLSNVGWALYCISTTYQMQGQFEKALPYSRESAEVYREAGDRRGLAIALGDAGWIEIFSGQGEAGRADLQESMDILESEGDAYTVASGLAGLAYLDRKEGNLRDATEHLLKALTIFKDFDDTTGIALVFDTLSNVLVDLGDCAKALRLGAAAEKLRDEYGGGAPPDALQLQDTRELCRGSLSPDEIEQSWNEGLALTVEAAVELAASR